ncbi:MAG TPA: M23 family metallopeptidase [Bosea sp. (in: a-proteobacteria)]|jgi:murein DD-endopeptidase MepM/ murein hydrolase activator NlpD|uniref:M23 family metallopeptidase n=1 Tax=Bosea sp. (in: a-proteobacteria) TaxID=1871050 RepID=UPI002DDD71AE|nr:M23 family metallopeptidase [Bosea sp. (in: a-proteobacteria)]HEV2555660.1 M23 family metallopeptidase [Bosea sp. (in: a-proteobacteria)]
MLQPARLKSRSGPEGGGERPVDPSRPAPRRRPSRVGRVGRIMVLLIALCGSVWSGVATWLLHQEKAVVAALQQEQQVLKASYDERMRVLTRRLVSSIATQRAPGTAPREGGADDQLADLIARQIELEARQNLLGTLTGQAVAPVLPNSGAQAPGGAGGLAAVDPFQGNILDRINPAVVAPQKRLVAVALRAEETLPLIERIALFQQSLDRIDQAQGQQVSALGLRLAGRVQEVRAALADLGLDVGKVRLPPARQAMGGPLIPLSVTMRAGSFEHRVLQLGEAQATFGRWRELAQIVPLRRPLDGDDSTTSNFGMRTDPFTGAAAMHSGMDFRGETGTPIRAAGAGKVLRAEVAGGYGNLVELDHGNGLTTRYAHLSAFDVKPDQIVPPGAIIGRLGSTGRSTGPHLHYETRLAGEATNPLKFIEIGNRLSQPSLPPGVR